MEYITLNKGCRKEFRQPLFYGVMSPSVQWITHKPEDGIQFIFLEIAFHCSVVPE